VGEHVHVCFAQMAATSRFQSGSPVAPETAELRPGDSLVTECVYNTVGRDNVTHFGQGTMDEMVGRKPEMRLRCDCPMNAMTMICSCLGILFQG
jgi:hypothetical protein